MDIFSCLDLLTDHVVNVLGCFEILKHRTNSLSRASFQYAIYRNLDISEQELALRFHEAVSINILSVSTLGRICFRFSSVFTTNISSLAARISMIRTHILVFHLF